MTVDLLTILSGERRGDDPRPDPGDVVTRIRCRCGDVVALVSRRAGETWLWRARYRHTPRGAAEIVIDAALDDFEALAAIAAAEPALEDDELSRQVHRIGGLVACPVCAPDDPPCSHLVNRLAAILPPLTMPARSSRITGMARFLADEAARHAAHDPPLAPPQLSNMLTGCGSCRAVVYVGNAAAQAEAAPAPPADLVTEDRPQLGIAAAGYGWPEANRPARVALYESLTVS